MVCRVCGGVVGTEAQYCSACGTRVSLIAPPHGTPMAGISAPRVSQNLHTLGVLWCVFGVYRLLQGLLGIFVLRVVALQHFGDGSPFWGLSHLFGSLWPGDLIHVVAVITVLSTAFALLTGYALMTRQPWGRTLAIVAGILTLIRIPFGTALGIYTLWVLAPADSGVEYESIVVQR